MTQSTQNEHIERLVRTWMATGREEEVDGSISEILSTDGSLLPLVKVLGEYLTSEEDIVRTKGVEFLSLVLARFPPEKLNRQSVRVLVAFFRGKLEDTETIVPALKGLVSLVSQPAFTSSDAVEVVQSLFQHVKMKALAQSQRFLVFSIIDTLIANQREALKGMGKDFLSGYINLADGEKDPRNLLLAFAIARVILIEFDISSHVEDVFNIVFCYFPITFRPPPDDPYGITSDDLKKALRACLNATPLFGPLAIPLFLEKLTAGSPATKRDTLSTLDACLPVYGPSVARVNARKLWNTLKLEIFQPTDPETEAKALRTTQILIQTIYSSEEQDHTQSSSDGAEIEGLAKEACEECIRILKEPEKSQAKPAIKVMCAFISTTPSVARFTLSQVVPHLVKLFLNPDEAPNRAPTLRLLSDIVVAARDSTLNDPEVLPTEGDVPLSPYKDEVLGVFTVGLKTPTTCKHAIDGLQGMVTTRGLLADEELGFAVHNVNELLSKDEDEDHEISEAILDLFTSVALVNPRHISETTLPLLFTSLPDHAPPRTADAERLKYWKTLAFLKRLCIQPELFEMLVVRLTTKLDLICLARPSDTQEKSDVAERSDNEPDAAYAHSILKTLVEVVASKVAQGHADVPKYIDRLVPRLYHLHIYSALISGNQYAVATDPRLIAVSADIVTLIVQTQSVQRQSTFAASLFAAYLDGDVKRVSDGQQKLPTNGIFEPLETNAPAVQKHLMVLFSAALIALHKEVSLPVSDDNVFLDRLLQWGTNQAETLQQREAAFQAIASVVNKKADGLLPFLSEKLESFWVTEVANPEVAIDKRRKVIVGWVWITKALLVRGHDLLMKYTDRLFELFADPHVSWDAARALGKIVGTDKVLTKQNHAVVKFLHAQKFFSAILPRIVEGAKSTEDPQKQNAYLVALTSLIKAIPKTTYAHELPTLMSLLLRGLDLPDADIRANVVDTFLAAADPTAKENNIISEHASSLVSTMLKNCMVQDMPSVRMRIVALRYLAVLPNLVRYDVLHPQKAMVLRELSKALDDPKRAVRKEAVEARTNWFKFTG